MINIKKISIFFLVIFFSFSNYSYSKSAPESFADLAEQLMPSVVNISTTQIVKASANPFPFEFPPDHLSRKCLKIFKNQLNEKPLH